MNRKGFTLIELLIVVVIIGILAAIAIPKFANTKEKAYLASMKSDLRNLITRKRRTSPTPSSTATRSRGWGHLQSVDGQHGADHRPYGGWLDG